MIRRKVGKPSGKSGSRLPEGPPFQTVKDEKKEGVNAPRG
jgi:hypothetical protein